jgi:hypothetical protein
MKLTLMTSSLSVAFLLIMGAPVANAAGSCLSADTIAEFMRIHVLPKWSNVTAAVLATEWPGGLSETARGPSAVTWAQVNENCAIYFNFVTSSERADWQLRGVRVMMLGSRSELLQAGLLLASAFGPKLNSTEERELRKHFTVGTMSRVPPSRELPGVVFLRNVNLIRNPRQSAAEESLWELEVLYERLYDPPWKDYPQFDDER